MFGPQVLTGGVLFRLWAPNQEAVSLALAGRDPAPMEMLEHGWHQILSAEAKVGMLYKFQLQDGLEVPDPASRFQPCDVHGPSEVVDAGSYIWTDDAWNGRPWEECVVYELPKKVPFRRRSNYLIISRSSELQLSN
jgi:1,4-alpha-glucan branching enzyme